MEWRSSHLSELLGSELLGSESKWLCTKQTGDMT